MKITHINKVECCTKRILGLRIFAVWLTISACQIFILGAIGCGGSASSTAAPSNIIYAPTSAVYTRSLKITDNVPSFSGSITTWNIATALPDGLIFNISTGVISGTPVNNQNAATYTVTATGPKGSASAVVSIKVNDAAPTALTYPQTAFVFTKNLSISEYKPGVTGTVSSWVITPDLPAGLNFDTSTGIISGKPTVCASAQTYTITGTNSGGSTKADISITVNEAAPSALSYGSVPYTCTKDISINEITPSVIGTVSSWLIAPDLPAGLSFDASNGKITGVPLKEQTMQTYTVTAANSGGSISADVQIIVNDLAPVNLTYAKSSYTYTVGEVVIGSDVPTVSGTVTTWSVSPSLPQGLILGTSNGIISGTPEVEAAADYYMVTAKNSGGSATTVLSITVNYAAPKGLSYANPAAVYTKGQSIVANAPSVTGTVTNWSIDKPLPSGLILDTTKGTISGIPEVLQTTAATYTITGKNSGGSASTSITITVNDAVPSGLSYTPSTVQLGKLNLINVPVGFGSHFTIYIYQPAAISLIPTCVGTITAWSINKPLPSGLIFDTATGVISGTTAQVSNRTGIQIFSTVYTITATNSGGSVSTTITTVGPY